MRKTMLQEHSFFSRPLIFFGSLQHFDEEIEDEKDWSFTDPWIIQTDLSSIQTPCIGLVIHWSNPNE
jgi:hypothetical protein